MEAKLEQNEHGLAPKGDGWFVVNARDARWEDAGPFGLYCTFEGDVRFDQMGLNVCVLQPGTSFGYYHEEPGHQENFLVLSGSCTLIVDEETRDLGPWDFVHCPPGVRHIIVGAGDGPSVVIGVGTRGDGSTVERGVLYPVSEVAARFGVSVARETNDPAEAYADAPPWTGTAYRDGSLPDVR